MFQVTQLVSGSARIPILLVARSYLREVLNPDILEKLLGAHGGIWLRQVKKGKKNLVDALFSGCILLAFCLWVKTLWVT